MRFMILRKADKNTEAGVLPPQNLLVAMGQYNEALVRAGKMLAGEGLQPSAKGVRMKLLDGKARIVDGPFSEAKELIAGFTMIDVASREEAIELARRWPMQDGDGNIELEIRELGCAGNLPGIDATAPPAKASPQRRFMILLKSDADTEAGSIPSASVLAAMARRNAEGVAAGVLVAGEGLQSSARGARLKFAQGKPALMDGPFTEAKEMIAGFWIVRAASMQEAISWVENYPYPRDADTEFEVEIRPLYEAADFGSEFTPELGQAEQNLREDVLRAAHQHTPQD